MSFSIKITDGDFFLGIVYVIEMFVNINSGYFEEGQIVYDRKKIFWRYLKK